MIDLRQGLIPWTVVARCFMVQAGIPMCDCPPDEQPGQCGCQVDVQGLSVERGFIEIVVNDQIWRLKAGSAVQVGTVGKEAKDLDAADRHAGPAMQCRKGD